MSGKRAWYWNRRAFKRNRYLLDVARRLDANLLRFYEGREDWPARSCASRVLPDGASPLEQ